MKSSELWSVFLAWLTNGEISEEESEKKFEEMMKEYMDNETSNLKVIAEEAISNAKIIREESNKDCKLLYERIKFLNDMGTCMVNLMHGFIEVRFDVDRLWKIFASGTPYTYYVTDYHYETICSSIEQLVRLIANHSVLKDFGRSAMESGVESYSYPC